jgi:hypothetical protein
MKKFINDLSPLFAFFFTAAVMSFIAFHLVSFVQKVLEAAPTESLTRGF